MASHLLLMCSLACAVLPAQHAPLLTFVGTAERGAGSEGEHTWLVDPMGDAPAEDLGQGRISVCDAFDGDWLVCRGWPDSCYMLLARRTGDDGSRAHRPLVPCGHCDAVPPFVDVQHRRLYVLSPRWDDRSGSLRVFEPGGPEVGRELLDRVQAVIARSLDGLFVMRHPEAGDPQASTGLELWFVPRQPGGARRVLDVTLHTGAHGLAGDVVFSPDHRHLAIGHHPLDGTGGAIWVVDTVAGALVAHLNGIPIGVSMLSSQTPNMRLAWQDASTLRFSRTGEDCFEWATWSLSKREVIAAEHYGPIGLRHERPPGAPVAGALHVDESGIRFAARPDSEASDPGPLLVERPAAGWWSGSSRLSLSADARYGVWFDGVELQLLDGPGRRQRIVHRGSFDLPTWVADRD